MSKHIDINSMPCNVKELFNTLCNQSFISRYTLFGGTALSIQIYHRLSEDLDFIYDEEALNINTIKRNITKLFPKHLIIRQDSKLQIDFVINDIKLTFFSAGSISLPFNVSSHALKYKKINICNISTLASLEMAAIAQRNTIRDYYDLYYLAKYHIPLLEIIQKTKSLLPNLSPVTYSETLIYTEDIDESNISGHLKPKEEINKEQIAAFFTKELIKIKDKIE